MRVLVIHNSYNNLGGEDIICDQEIDLLKNNGFEVDVLKFDNKNIRLSKFIYNSDSKRITENRIKEFKPDVVHIHNLFYQATASVIDCCYELNVPTVFTLHNYRLICSNALLMRENKVCEKCTTKVFPLQSTKHKCFQDSYVKSLMLTATTGIHKKRKTWNKISKFVTLTDFSKNKFLNSSLGINENQIVVKPNSVNDFGLSEIESREDYFLFVGRLSHEKGIKTLWEAFKNTTQKIIIIGDGPLRDQFEKNANSNVTFLGFQSQSVISEKMKKAKALIVSSVCYEGLPTTVLEAFSCGTPVISSDIGNINTIVTDAHNGHHFKTGNANNLTKIIKSYKITEELIANARETFVSKYTHEQNILNLKMIYNSVIQS